MSAPAHTPDTGFSLEQARTLFQRITQNDHEIAFPLFLLLKGVVDPDGDQDRYRIADQIMKEAVFLSPQFEEWYRSLGHVA